MKTRKMKQYRVTVQETVERVFLIYAPNRIEARETFESTAISDLEELEDTVLGRFIIGLKESTSEDTQ